MYAIVWNDTGWWIMEINYGSLEHELVQGPYDTLAEAEEAIKTRAYRIAQGWTP